MRTKTTYFRIIALTVVIFTAITSVVVSQGTDSRSRYAKEGKLYLGVLITPQTTSIKNSDFAGSYGFDQKNGLSMNITLDGGYFFSKMLGVIIGAGMGSYSSEVSMDSCIIKFNATDSDNESYIMNIKGESISEKQKISYLNVPVCAIIKFPPGNNLEFYVKAGLSFNIPLVKTYEGTGKFSYSGYYSAYPVLLEDIPNIFPSNVATTSSDNLEVKPFTMMLAAGAGATYKINESIQVLLGLNYNMSLGSISAYTTDSDYRISPEPNKMYSVMGGTSGAGLTGLGMSLGVRYYLR